MLGPTHAEVHLGMIGYGIARVALNGTESLAIHIQVQVDTRLGLVIATVVNTDRCSIHPFVGNHAGMLFLGGEVVADAVQTLCGGLGLRTAVLNHALIEGTGLLKQTVVEIGLCLFEGDSTL